MYLLPLRLDRRLFVGTTAVYFAILNAAKLPAYIASGQFAKADPAWSLRLFPIVLAGALAGYWLNRKMSDRIFSAFVYAATFVLGWYVLGDGVLKLLARPEPA